MPKSILKKIGIWSGSSPATSIDFERGIKRLKALGFEAVIPQATRRNFLRKESGSRPYLAGPDAQKVEAFVELWERPDIDDILCVRGGYGSLRLLALLDEVSLEPSHPKSLWGFSDLTCIQNYLYKRLALPWVHSPMLTSQAFLKPRKGIEENYWKKRDPSHCSRFKLKNLHIPVTCTQTKISAPLIGGNLACFLALSGTPWEAREEPLLLFLEDIKEGAYKIDRLLSQLQNLAFMRECLGIVLGHFTECEGALKVIKAWAQEQGYPVFSGLPAGHDRPNIPIPMGKTVDLTLESKNVSYLEVPKLFF